MTATAANPPRTVVGGCPRCLDDDHANCLRLFGNGPEPLICRCHCRPRIPLRELR